MTSQALMILVAFSLLKGVVFGALFAWMFPPMYRWLIRRMGGEDETSGDVVMERARSLPGLGVSGEVPSPHIPLGRSH